MKPKPLLELNHFTVTVALSALYGEVARAGVCGASNWSWENQIGAPRKDAED